MSEKIWMSVSEAAEALGVSKGLVRKWADEGRFDVNDYRVWRTQLTHGDRRIPIKGIDNFRENNMGYENNEAVSE